MTRARCIDCIFHHIHSTCSAITSTPPGFTPEFALQLLRLPCNPPSHGRAYHSSPPPLESRLCIHQAWPQLQNITSSQGFPRVFNSVDPQSTTHDASDVPGVRFFWEPPRRTSEERRRAYHSTFHIFIPARLRILQRIPPMNRTSRHCRAVRVAMLSRHTYEVASTAVSMKGDVRMRIQNNSSLSPHLRYHEPSDPN